jgi:hypothetical protein
MIKIKMLKLVIKLIIIQENTKQQLINIKEATQLLISFQSKIKILNKM